MHQAFVIITRLQFLGRVAARGVMLAGGLHPDIAPKYFRCARMVVVTFASVMVALGLLAQQQQQQQQQQRLGSAVLTRLSSFS